MSRRFSARTTGARWLVIGAALVVAAIPSLLAGQVSRAQPASASPGQVVRLRAGAGPVRRTPADASVARPLTVAEKVNLVMPARLGNQPEAPILLNANTTIIPGRATMSLKNANLFSGLNWGLSLSQKDSELEIRARLDGSKAHLFDCLVFQDNPSTTVYLASSGQSTAITMGSGATHVTWVLVTETADWYTISLKAATPASPMSQLEISYCEITPFK